MRFSDIHFNSFFAFLAAASCALALNGRAYASPPEESTSSAVGKTIQGEAVEPSYNKKLPLWGSDKLRHPAPAAMLDPAKGDLPPAADTGSLEKLTIGMIEQDVIDAVGEPPARGERGLWQYVARNVEGAYAATLWFNEEQRLWMGQTDHPPVNSLFIARAPIAKETITLSASEFFAFDSDTLRLPQPKLDAIAEALLKRSKGNEVLVVNGYTDRLGSDAHNLALSQRRAQAVRNYFVHQGVSPNRVEAVGKGEANSVVTCNGIKGRAALIECLAPNRRVEIGPLTIDVSEIH